MIPVSTSSQETFPKYAAPDGSYVRPPIKAVEKDMKGRFRVPMPSIKVNRKEKLTIGLLPKAP